MRRALVALAALLAACGGSDAKNVTGPGPTGVIAVQVSGLPAGLQPRITVIPPSGAPINLTSPMVLTGLLAGDYQVEGLYVTSGSVTYAAQVSSPTVTLLGNDTAAVAVTYTAGGATTLNLQVAGVQLIQSTQRADGSVPMIAGRDAMIRVFVTANQANSAQPVVRVRLFQGTTQVDSFNIAAPGAGVPLSADTSSLAASWNVVIPGARMLPGLSVQAVVDPDDGVAETNNADNVFPGAGKLAVTVDNVPAFSLRFVPVKQAVNNLTGNVSATNKGALADLTTRMHPLGAVNVDLRATFTTSAPVLMSNDSNGAWGQILSEIYALRTSDHGTADYVGIVPVTYGGGIAGLGYVGAPAAIAWDKASSAPGVIAHELGHNFGRQHAPCGSPSGPDPNYPYPNASIGTWGLDLPALTLKAPGTYKDLMSYCNPDWISDYNYVAVLNFRGVLPFAAAQAAAAPSSPSGDGLLVWGRIVNGNVMLEPAFVVNAPATLPPAPGPHQVEGLDSAGNRVFSLSFAGELVADLPHGDERHFAFVLPLGAAERARLAAVKLTGLGLTAVRRAGGESVTAQAPGTAPVRVARQGGDLDVHWDPSYPMALVRDARSGQILSFARGGAGRISAPGAVRIELLQGVTTQPGVTLVVP